jgi:glucuronate isomerase
MPAAHASVLHEDRFFDADPAVRRVARVLYEETRGLPIVSPHGHVDAGILADDSPFPEPTSLIITPDHYILRMLYSRGSTMEQLGIARRGVKDVSADPRATWKLFAANYHLFRATPTAAWLDYELAVVFGIRARLESSSASRIYDEVAERLASPEFRPRALFERFNIEVLATTNPAGDSLGAHARLRASGWPGCVIPTFRPDVLIDLSSPAWRSELDAVSAASGIDVRSYPDYIRAIEKRRGDFRALGATATDHGVEVPATYRLPDEVAERAFVRALAGQATDVEANAFRAHMLMELARMSVADGLVMQLHAGALRNHNEPFSRSYGPHLGGDIPVVTEYTRNLRPLLNAYGNDPSFRLVLFTLDESTYARELAPLAGHYPAVLLGAPWWFHDSVEGMRRYREQVTETAGIWNTVGFTDDTRAFCSIPARHDLSRRVDANWLAGLVARHVIDLADAQEMARALAYDLAKTAYRLDKGER